jgi:hypothetical protein
MPSIARLLDQEDSDVLCSVADLFNNLARQGE